MADHSSVIGQFKTSRFLQAHVDLFASEAAAAGQAVPPIVVVQTTRDPSRTYVAETMARFANPFLDHRLADIADHHPDKLRKRIGGFLSWVDSAAAAPPLPELDAIMSRADVPVA